MSCEWAAEKASFKRSYNNLKIFIFMTHVSTIAFNKTWIRPNYRPVTLSLIDSFPIVKVRT